MKKQTNIPLLRFPKFKGEWEKKPLIELSENGFSNGAFNDPEKVGSGYRIINVKDRLFRIVKKFPLYLCC